MSKNWIIYIFTILIACCTSPLFVSASGLDLSIFPTTDLHFNYNGNDFWWRFFFENSIDIETNVVLDWIIKSCNKQIRWYYFNPARGLTVWPLDQDSLVNLQNLDVSYLDLSLSGGLFICDDWSIYGNITHEWKSNIYYLIAWVDYNFINNAYLPTFLQSMKFTNGITSGYVFDSYGGIASLNGNGLTSMESSTGNVIIHSTLGVLTWDISFYKDLTWGNASATIDIGTYAASFSQISASSTNNHRFVIKDMFWKPFTVTIQASDLISTNWTISASNIWYEWSVWTGIGKSLTASPTGYIDIGSTPITFVSRNNNTGISWYEQDITLKVIVPPAQSPWSYTWILTFTY